MTNDYISIGIIKSTFGLKGLLKVYSDGDILPSLDPPTTIYIEMKGILSPYDLIGMQGVKPQISIQLRGIDSIDQAEHFVGKKIFFLKKEAERLLETDEFYVHQLIGLIPFFGGTVYSSFKLIDVIENPAHPILLFSNGDTEVLIPYINKFVGKVDLQLGKIEILNWEEWLDAV